MAKSKTKAQASKGKAASKAAAYSKKAAKPKAKEIRTASADKGTKAQAPASADIRKVYKKTLLGKYLDKQKRAPAVKK